MSLYQLQKILYELNRDEDLRERFGADKEVVLEKYNLDPEECQALCNEDIGLLYVLGVNGQILMHFAAMCGYAWPDYIQAMRDGLHAHGSVRAGLYATYAAADTYIPMDGETLAHGETAADGESVL